MSRGQSIHWAVAKNRVAHAVQTSGAFAGTTACHNAISTGFFFDGSKTAVAKVCDRICSSCNVPERLERCQSQPLVTEKVS